MTTYRKFSEGRSPDAFFEFFDDFMKYTAGDWTITTTEAGAGSAAEAIIAGAGGLLQITNDDADNDLDFFQTAELFKFTTGKKLQFKARFKVNDATESDLVIGLHVTDTDPVGGVVDGIFFRKDDGDANLDVVVVKDSTASTAAAVATLANDTFVEVEFYYDGGDDIDYYVDGVRLGSLPVTNAPDDEEIAVSFGIQNGAAAAKVLTMDYVLARQER